MHNLELIDYQDAGWPFPVMSCDEIVLTRCPNLVLPATFMTRDTMIIDDGELRVQIVFDDTVT